MQNLCALVTLPPCVSFREGPSRLKTCPAFFRRSIVCHISSVEGRFIGQFAGLITLTVLNGRLRGSKDSRLTSRRGSKTQDLPRAAAPRLKTQDSRKGEITHCTRPRRQSRSWAGAAPEKVLGSCRERSPAAAVWKATRCSPRASPGPSGLASACLRRKRDSCGARGL